MLFSSWRPAAFTSEERRTRASLGSWWTTSSRRSGVRLDWWDQIASWHEANTFWQTFFDDADTRLFVCCMPGLFALQEEGSVCRLQRQKLSEDGPLCLQQWAAVPLPVHRALPVSNRTLTMSLGIKCLVIAWHSSTLAALLPLLDINSLLLQHFY